MEKQFLSNSSETIDDRDVVLNYRGQVIKEPRGGRFNLSFNLLSFITVIIDDGMHSNEYASSLEVCLKCIYHLLSTSATFMTDNCRIIKNEWILLTYC